MWGPHVCAALLCCSSCWNQVLGEAEQSLRAPFAGSEGQCQTAITASLPVCDTWHIPCQMGLKDVFVIKPQQIFSWGALCIQFGVCKGECKSCAVVRDPPGTADVSHLAVRLTCGILTHVCQVVSCVYLLKCTSVAVNRDEKLSATMMESEPYVQLLQQCNRDISFSSGSTYRTSLNSSTFQNCTLVQFWKYHFCWA